MSASVNRYITEKLEERKAQNTFRQLFLPEGQSDFFSNDYLGIATKGYLENYISETLKTLSKHTPIHGSTGSRLLSGNSSLYETIEKKLADIHQTEAALLFNAGYNANLGVLGALPYKNATVFYDELVHASMHDGMKMGKAKRLAFRHNSIPDLEEKLAKESGLKFIAIEALYSMDGDFAPLQAMVHLAQKYDAAIILDEAHSTGVYGTQGEGIAQDAHLHKDIFIRIHTFGKAAGVHGAVVLCNENTKQFLVNYCRPFIFSTAMPPLAVAAVSSAYDFFKSEKCAIERAQLIHNIEYFQQLGKTISQFHFSNSTSAIQTLFVPGNEQAKTVAAKIRSEGFEVRAILSPTVPKGTERIRICLHSFNTHQEIEDMIKTIAAF